MISDHPGIILVWPLLVFGLGPIFGMVSCMCLYFSTSLGKKLFVLLLFCCDGKVHVVSGHPGFIPVGPFLASVLGSVLIGWPDDGQAVILVAGLSQ